MELQRQRGMAVIAAVLATFCAATASAAVGNPYAEQRAAAARRCEAISRSDYQTGLWLNPDGYRSYYARSACFQEVAVLFRDRAFCDEVRRRWALFSSSWGYSAGNCRKLVAEGLVRDSTEIEKTKTAYRAGPVRLEELRIERNGNGRDYDILPTFTAGYSAGYTLRVEVMAGGRAVAIDSSGYHLSGGDNIRGFVRVGDIAARVAGFAAGRSYRVRATLVLSVGFGGQAGMWSEEFIERRFPVAARTQSIAREIAF